MGSKNQGQGHETVFKQVLNERLGIDPNEVQYIDGDTDRVAFGIGTNGSRSTVIAGSALWTAADKIIAKGRKMAAHLLEAAEADIEFADGAFVVAGTDRRIPITDVAKATFQVGKLPPGFEGGLYETGTFSPSDTTYPNGCHVCEAEIDPDTGEVEIVSYVVVDDVGTVVNPIGLKGQIHGGVAQGLGQAVMERVVYDREVRADAERQLYGLRNAARCRHAVYEGREQPLPDPAQSLRGQGSGRGRHGRRIAGGRQCGARRAGAARRQADRDADDAGSGVGGDPGGARLIQLCGIARRIPPPCPPPQAGEGDLQARRPN